MICRCTVDSKESDNIQWRVLVNMIYGNEPLGFVIGGEFLYQLNYCNLLKKNSFVGLMFNYIM
jgi:hypothetical protein